MSNNLVRSILHIEQNPADIEMVKEFLAGDSPHERYEIQQVNQLDEGLEVLRDLANPIDAVLVHLRRSAEGVLAIRRTATQVPVIVLTGYEDEELAIQAIDAGAQDYLFKNDLTARALRRSIGYSISRKREAEMRGLSETLQRFRALASENSQTQVTARAMGVGPIKASAPDVFDECISYYSRLMKRYVTAPLSDHAEPREAMERLVTKLGDLGAGPKDLIDLHAAALEETANGDRRGDSGIMILEGRLFALEMMGLLVNYYRIGHRRMAWGR